MKSLRVKIPDRLYEQMEELVQQGWFRSQEDIIDDALRRFLESHRPELMEQYMRDDIAWGLRGGK
jgi:Arc/MetJ-type ribon-helix-helix transcriptional regulator